MRQPKIWNSQPGLREWMRRSPILQEPLTCDSETADEIWRTLEGGFHRGKLLRQRRALHRRM